MIVKSIPINWHQDLPIFASENFLRAVSDEYGWLGGFDERGQLLCVLPYTIIRKAFVKLVRFRVETVPLKEDLNLDEEKAFLNGVINYLKKLGADIIIPATTNTIFKCFPDGAIAAPYGTFKIDLTQNEETIWKEMSESHRRKIRQAEKSGIVIRNGIEYAEAAYKVIKDTFRRSKLGFMKLSDFQKYLSGLGKNVMISVAEYKHKIQACLVIPFSQYSAYYVYGGSTQEPSPGATNLLHWQAIRHFKQLGVRYYDFVGVRLEPEKGSKQEGLSQYKERFGGKLYKGYIWKYALNRPGYLLYSLGIKLLRGGDIVDAEKHKLGKVKMDRN
ncbi:MAG: peptidoglycan bridge formation glycyltransferase FemA/FemB family protein [Candidatus Saccharicenans sp.]|jgi:hypothetical protein|nr:peptidoglycan bridge formation glycyltransferase FemA/FemB family protein [Candidatus Saccharicenans sp.]MDH7575636.1 peptidoglycan bridge formation glycyltransferase FemA/FemB family protein [Candidatus Saccharicenans sp.]